MKNNKTEFYPTLDTYSEEMNDFLIEWLHCRNWDRLHSTHKANHPKDEYFELSDETPYRYEVVQNYVPCSEHVQLLIIKRN